MMGVVLTGAGVLAVAAASYAESYHSRRFREHLDAMKCAYLHRGEHEAAREHREFTEDRRVDIAIHVMTWGYPLGVLLAIVGVALLIT